MGYRYIHKILLIHIARYQNYNMTTTLVSNIKGLCHERRLIKYITCGQFGRIHHMLGNKMNSGMWQSTSLISGRCQSQDG